MFVKAPESIEFSKELNEFIEEWKDRPGNLIMVLHRVQEEFGYIPRAAAIEVAHRLGVNLAKIYGVITFYHFFKLSKPGKHKIQVCMGTACYLRRAEDLIQELENILGVGLNTVTEDGMFSVEAVRCVGCCGLAPVIMVGKDVYGKLTKSQLPEIIARYRGQNGQAG